MRYDEDGQQSLSKHTDSSHVSFNILLNDEFEGGGTRFHNTLQDTYVDIKPKPGQVLLNNAIVFHEGLATTKGTRYIMVGFMNVETVDPLTKRPSSLSKFASYLSISWLSATLKDRIDQEDLRSEENAISLPGFDTSTSLPKLILASARVLVYILYQISTLHVSYLVDSDQEESYLDSLIEFSKQHRVYLPKGANWFSGQNLEIGLDGNLEKMWPEREKNKEAFDEMLEEM